MIMNYQLPTGKVVYLSIEEFLDLTDEDIQYLIAHDCGDHIINPFSGSSINSKPKELKDFDFDIIPTDDEPNTPSQEDIKKAK